MGSSPLMMTPMLSMVKFFLVNSFGNSPAVTNLTPFSFVTVPPVVNKRQYSYSLVENLDTPSRSSCVKPIRSRPIQQRVGLWPRIKDQVGQVVLLLLVSGLLTLITYYYWTSGTTGFESFMDSQGFGIRFMMTVVGVVIKTIWGNIDQSKVTPLVFMLLTDMTQISAD